MLFLILIIIMILAIIGVGIWAAIDKDSDGFVGYSIGTAVYSAVIVVLCGFASVFTIQAGEVGVRFDPFAGGVSEQQYTEGLHLKAPWVTVYGYNARTQKFTLSDEIGEISDEDFGNVTKEGLSLDLNLTVQYHIDPTKAWELRKSVGTDGSYQSLVVNPTIFAALREAVSQHSAEEIYGTGKTVVEQELKAALTESLKEYNIIVENVLLSEVELPTLLKDAIESKLQAQQEALQMEYILQKERLEAERKVVEAEGIANANAIISDSITSNYLYWYWIEMLKQNPSTIYVVPSDGGGLPTFTVPLEE